MNTSFFEIGGHIIECDTDDPSSASVQRTELALANTKYEMGGMSDGFIERRARTDRKPSVQEYGSVPGRVRRARLAFGIAGTMAMVDGPLPVGDAVGIAVLIGYGSYEIYKSSEILSRAIFS